MIAILNFGSQYNHLIARRIREAGAAAEILPYNISNGELRKLKPKGIIFSGGPKSVNDKNFPAPNREIFKLHLPVLGICYGHQVIAKLLGGKIETPKIGRFGKEYVFVKNHNPLFCGLSSKQKVWFSNNDIVTRLPKGFKNIATNHSCPHAAMANNKARIYGVQFHPEVIHTENGKKIISNFVYKICQAEKNQEVKGLSGKLISEVQKEVGENNILLGVSGGVDSTVLAALLHKACGNKLYCVFVDHGLMRKNEVIEIKNIFKKLKVKNFKIVDAQSLFLNKLKGVSDPEKKRKAIGHTFIEVFEAQAKQLAKNAHIGYLAQGTIYPDRIESAKATNKADKIKSHHNLTLPKKLNLTLVEPLRDLYKDEVRELGLELGLPKEIIYRHPFPGPGLAVRILGEITGEKIKILQAADDIYISEIKKSKDYGKISQAFAALLPVKSVGVMGDMRTYSYIISLRAVTTEDFMTCDWYHFGYELLRKISSRIVNEVKGVNRVVYDITQKPPATVEYE
ncbi:glutamine-hydrolyzing GMP synthase [Candidatus Parcubacteria bacterium]|nr:MAG: glutamine-hydrolyzing GMP synthase [Candidatus Parcubacteria bacterium]